MIIKLFLLNTIFFINIMKQLLQSIQEKLVFNKHTKEKQYNLNNASLDEFKKLIKEKLDYDLTYEDFSHFRNGFLPNGKKTSEAKFTDVTDDNKEWSVYYPISKNNTEQIRKYYIIQELNTGCLFDYINTKIDVYSDYRMYRIGYVLDNIENRENRDMVKIFKIDFD